MRKVIIFLAYKCWCLLCFIHKLTYKVFLDIFSYAFSFPSFLFRKDSQRRWRERCSDKTRLSLQIVCFQFDVCMRRNSKLSSSWIIYFYFDVCLEMNSEVIEFADCLCLVCCLYGQKLSCFIVLWYIIPNSVLVLQIISSVFAFILIFFVL